MTSFAFERALIIKKSAALSSLHKAMFTCFTRVVDSACFWTYTRVSSKTRRIYNACKAREHSHKAMKTNVTQHEQSDSRNLSSFPLHSSALWRLDIQSFFYCIKYNGLWNDALSSQKKLEVMQKTDSVFSVLLGKMLLGLEFHQSRSAYIHDSWHSCPDLLWAASEKNVRPLYLKLGNNKIMLLGRVYVTRLKCLNAAYLPWTMRMAEIISWSAKSWFPGYFLESSILQATITLFSSRFLTFVFLVDNVGKSPQEKFSPSG